MNINTNMSELKCAFNVCWSFNGLKVKVKDGKLETRHPQAADVKKKRQLISVFTESCTKCLLCAKY